MGSRFCSSSSPIIIIIFFVEDYVNTVANAATLGGSSLLMGATKVAPSKDTLWTASPQPPTYRFTFFLLLLLLIFFVPQSDQARTGDYTTQPHVQLDSVLATLSLGPVGISDDLNRTDVGTYPYAFYSSYFVD